MSVFCKCVLRQGLESETLSYELEDILIFLIGMNPDYSLFTVYCGLRHFFSFGHAVQLSSCKEYRTLSRNASANQRDFFFYFNGCKIHTPPQTPIANLDF